MQKEQTAQQNIVQNGLHVLYKNLGETPLECVLRFKKDNLDYADVPMTYAGRLDPMAEGVLLVLSGDAILDKQKYLDLPKTYTFQVLWGVKTDSLDVLGLVSGESSVIPDQGVVEMEVQNKVGKFDQKYPAYSSKPIDGVPMFQLAREGKSDELNIPKHEVELFEAKFISRRTISSKLLVQYIVPKVNLVNGDFRQKEIIEKWEEVMSKSPLDIFVIDIFEVKVGSGFYVRQFVSDLAESFGTVATTFHIRRDKAGEFVVEK